MPARVSVEAKAALLDLIDHAVGEGWSHQRACRMLGVDERRARRWARRRDAGALADRAGGGHPVHGLLAAEVQAILALESEWGEIDASHRKLAHRGSYERRVWVSPATVRRVLAAHGRVLPHRPRREPRTIATTRTNHPHDPRPTLLDRRPDFGH